MPSPTPLDKDALLRLLDERDEFIVAKGLWAEFCATLDKPPVSAPEEAEIAEIRKRHSQNCLNEVAATTMDCADDWSRDIGSQAHRDRATLLRALSSRAAQPQMPTREQIKAALAEHMLEGYGLEECLATVMALFPASGGEKK